MVLPLEYVGNMKNLLGENEYKEYLESFQNPRLNGLRFNLLKCLPENTEAIEKELQYNLSPVPWCTEGRYIADSLRPAKHPYYFAGLYYLQEPSAMSPAAILPISENDRVLDLCAAPGGKATQLGSRLCNSGILFANDISTGRTKALLKNIEMFGIRNVICLSETPARLAERLPLFFDKILIDAPCSGEGMFRKEPSMTKSWNAEMHKFCQKQQKEILEEAAKMLKPGGMMLYSTCTFSYEENEKSIEQFLEQHNDFSFVSIEKRWGFQEGIGGDDQKACARLYPHKLEGEGHFLALLQKKENDSHGVDFDREINDNDTRMEYYYDFCKETLIKPILGKFKVYGDNLYILPQGTPKLSGLRVIRSGWLLGIFKKNRFEPSQALAMGLRLEEVKNTINLSLEDHRVIRYLKGETIEVITEKEGWHVLFVDGNPLGFGKVQKGRLKNKYPASWKWE